MCKEETLQVLVLFHHHHYHHHHHIGINVLTKNYLEITIFISFLTDNYYITSTENGVADFN